MESFNNDLTRTINNRNKLFRNKNLLYWYKKSYEEMFSVLGNINKISVLEIGSGTSPISFFYPHIKTSDVLPLRYIDYNFDALSIDKCVEIMEYKFDIITFSNVLHHIEDPISLLLKCEKKLNLNGKIVFIEPYFSFFSKIIYNNIHHEFSDTNIEKPFINDISGPLSSSNIALPYLIFYKRKDWMEKILEVYKVKREKKFSFISYFLTGGISLKIPIPLIIYKFFFRIDIFFSKYFPSLFCSFFIVELEKRIKN